MFLESLAPPQPHHRKRDKRARHGSSVATLLYVRTSSGARILNGDIIRVPLPRHPRMLQLIQTARPKQGCTELLSERPVERSYNLYQSSITRIDGRSPLLGDDKQPSLSLRLQIGR